MRNAGDRAPGGSPGRRQRAAAPDASSRSGGSGGSGGASLFTPAYRVSHAGSGGRAAGPGRSQDSSDSGYVTSGGRDGAAGRAPGYDWPEADQGRPGEGYRHEMPGDDGGEPLWPGDSGPDSGYERDQDDDPWPGSGATWSRPAAPGVSPAVRGFAPLPGDPLPVYPPGPFAAWNRSPADRDGQRSRGRAHTGTSPQLAAATITPDEFDTDYSIPAIKDPVAGPAAPSGRTGRADGPQVRDRRASMTSKDTARRSRADGKRGGRPAAGRKAKRQPAWHAIAAAVAIIAAGTVILVLTTRSNPPARPKAVSTPTPAASSAAPPAGRWKYIGSRKTDPVPLTTTELYPAGVKSGSTDYTKVKQAEGANCSGALIGSALKSAVKKGGCTQAVRATYVAHPGGLMATIGVFNLDSAAAASQAAKRAGHFSFVAQLQSRSGPASKIGQGTGIEEAIVKGHYLVLVWAERTDLSAPKNHADRTRLATFVKLLSTKTANAGLSYRMVYGKPAPAPAGTTG